MFWCSLGHTISRNSTEGKIMQKTFLSNGLAFLPFSCHSISIIAVFWENCLACVWQLYFSREPWQSKRNKEPCYVIGLRLYWQPMVKCAKCKFDATNGHIITILFPFCKAGDASKLEMLQSFYQFSVRPTVLKKRECDM